MIRKKIKEPDAAGVPGKKFQSARVIAFENKSFPRRSDPLTFSAKKGSNSQQMKIFKKI